MLVDLQVYYTAIDFFATAENLMIKHGEIHSSLALVKFIAL